MAFLLAGLAGCGFGYAAIDRVSDKDVVVLDGTSFAVSYKPAGATPHFGYKPVGEAPDYGYVEPKGVYFPRGAKHEFLEVWDGGIPMVMVERSDGVPLTVKDGELGHKVALIACQQNPDWHAGLRERAKTDEWARDGLAEVGKGFLKEGRWTYYEACE